MFWHIFWHSIWHSIWHIFWHIIWQTSGILSGKHSGTLSGIPSGILSGISSGILSGISSGICSGISSGILSGISSGILSGKPSGILSGKHSGTLSGISSYMRSGRKTWRGYSRLRSGREHWAWILAVEVRQGTLGVDTRGWGPAGNTGRGWSWLRSGREHWAWMVVVEVRQRTLWIASRSWAGGRGGQWEEEEDEEEEDQATDIKSNNPHLAGGELYACIYAYIKYVLHGIYNICLYHIYRVYGIRINTNILICLEVWTTCQVENPHPVVPRRFPHFWLDQRLQILHFLPIELPHFLLQVLPGHIMIYWQGSDQTWLLISNGTTDVCLCSLYSTTSTIQCWERLEPSSKNVPCSRHVP